MFLDIVKRAWDGVGKARWAIQTNSRHITLITDPTVEQQLLHISSWGSDAIANIEKPCREAQMAVAQHRHQNLFHLVREVHPDAALVALGKDGLLIRYIAAPTEEQKIVAVRQNHMALIHIAVQSERLHEIALRKTATAFTWMQRPTERITLRALRAYGDHLEKVADPTPEMIEAAIANTPPAIRFVKNPTEEQMWSAIHRMPRAFKYLKYPTDEMRVFYQLAVGID